MILGIGLILVLFGIGLELCTIRDSLNRIARALEDPINEKRIKQHFEAHQRLLKK